MDIEYSFNEKVIITPRDYIIKFKKEKTINNHYALIGIGTIVDNYPLYADVVNEYGLGLIALNFPTYCKYQEYKEGSINLAPYELSLYLLSKYKSIKEIKKIINSINIVNIDFSNSIKLTPLHFMLSDKNESVVIEVMENGITIYNNPYNILTNNPPFNFHKINLINYMNLSNRNPSNNLNNGILFNPYSNGLGALGLPGDFSSTSRFIKGYFVKNFLSKEEDDVIQFFKCLESISMIKGCVVTDKGLEYTTYTSCYDLNKHILYFKTYFSFSVYKIKLFNYKLNSNDLLSFNLYYDNTYSSIE